MNLLVLWSTATIALAFIASAMSSDAVCISAVPSLLSSARLQTAGGAVKAYYSKLPVICVNSTGRDEKKELSLCIYIYIINSIYM